MAANRRASLISVKWNGTVVTLAWEMGEPVRPVSGAVWRILCQNPRYFRSGSDAHLGVAVGQFLGHEIDSPSGEPPVGALDEVERHAGEPEVAPGLGKLAGLLFVKHEVDGPDFVRREDAGVLDRPSDCKVETVDEHQHHVASEMWAVVAVGMLALQRLLPLVLAGQPDEEQHHQGHEHDDQPCPWVNLVLGYYRHDYEAENGADPG